MTPSDWIALVSAAIALISAVIAGLSLKFSYEQWQKVKAKIGMITDWGKASEVLPAWYTGRMMSDDWLFGLLTIDGRTLVVTRINALSDDGKWLDVDLSTKEYTSLPETDKQRHVFAIAGDRTSASIQVSTIVAAMELQTS